MKKLLSTVLFSAVALSAVALSKPSHVSAATKDTDSTTVQPVIRLKLMSLIMAVQQPFGPHRLWDSKLSVM